MSRFGHDPLAFFNGVYAAEAPWDIGASQPALDDLYTSYPPASPALDLGCGSGDIVIALGQLGVDVLGIDFVPAAVELSRRRASALTTEVARRLDFTVADALDLSALGRKFNTVVDSGFYHLFDPPQCARLVDQIRQVLLPGGRLYMLEFAVTFDIPNVPRGISQDEIRAQFTEEKGWRILALHDAEFLNRVAATPATCACIERVE